MLIGEHVETKMHKIEYVDCYKIVHSIPDYTEEQKEEMRQEILRNMYKLFSSRMSETDSKVKTNYSTKIHKG
jgi:hypothetical protein